MTVGQNPSQPTPALERFSEMHRTKLTASLVFVVALLCLAFPETARPTPAVGVAVSIRIAPPILPVYAQPLCPGPGYIWEPGYWAYRDNGYYWVPGIWVLPPRAGLLWTPGYWGFSNGVYLWNAGYWGLSVGFYGGINYGFGYPGVGFYGGYWRGNQYFYNTQVTNINRTVIHNVYSRNVGRGYTSTRASFNGPRGVNARPTAAELSAAHQSHVAMTSAQVQHQREARTTVASTNHSRPDVATNGRANELSHRREPPANSRAGNTERPAANNRTNSAHPERPVTHSTAPAAKPAPARPERPATTHAAKPAPSRTERPSAEHRAAPKSSPAPSHTTKAPEHQPAPKPEATHTERHAAPQAERHTAPAPKPATHPSTSRPAHEQSPSSSHASASHSTQSHAAAPHAAASHPAHSEQPHTSNNKPEHPEH
jgi:hypothetical protein